MMTMSDNDPIQARILSEEELGVAEQFALRARKHDTDKREQAASHVVLNLIATIRDRDKTIAEKEESRQSWRAVAQFRDERIQELTQQNTIMLSALAFYAEHKGWVGERARDTVAQVDGGERYISD